MKPTNAAHLIFAIERDYHYDLGIEYTRQGKKDEAGDHFDKAAEYHEKAIGKENILTNWEADLLIQEKSLN